MMASPCVPVQEFKGRETAIQPDMVLDAGSRQHPEPTIPTHSYSMSPPHGRLQRPPRCAMRDMHEIHVDVGQIRSRKRYPSLRHDGVARCLTAPKRLFVLGYLTRVSGRAVAARHIESVPGIHAGIAARACAREARREYSRRRSTSHRVTRT